MSLYYCQCITSNIWCTYSWIMQDTSICRTHLSNSSFPRFEVVCEDEEESVVVGMSPAECHNHILHTINSTLNMDLLTIRWVLYHKVCAWHISLSWSSLECLSDGSLGNRKKVVVKHENYFWQFKLNMTLQVCFCMALLSPEIRLILMLIQWWACEIPFYLSWIKFFSFF